MLLTETTNATIADAAGVLWRTQDIYVVSGLVSIFTMIAFTVLSLMKIAELPAAVRNTAEKSARNQTRYKEELQLK